MSVFFAVVAIFFSYLLIRSLLRFGKSLFKMQWAKVRNRDAYASTAVIMCIVLSETAVMPHLARISAAGQPTVRNLPPIVTEGTLPPMTNGDLAGLVPWLEKAGLYPAHAWSVHRDKVYKQIAAGAQAQKKASEQLQAAILAQTHFQEQNPHPLNPPELRARERELEQRHLDAYKAFWEKTRLLRDLRALPVSLERSETIYSTDSAFKPRGGLVQIFHRRQKFPETLAMAGATDTTDGTFDSFLRRVAKVFTPPAKRTLPDIRSACYILFRADKTTRIGIEPICQLGIPVQVNYDVSSLECGKHRTSNSYRASYGSEPGLCRERWSIPQIYIEMTASGLTVFPPRTNLFQGMLLDQVEDLPVTRWQLRTGDQTYALAKPLRLSWQDAHLGGAERKTMTLIHSPALSQSESKIWKKFEGRKQQHVQGTTNFSATTIPLLGLDQVFKAADFIDATSSLHTMKFDRLRNDIGRQIKQIVDLSGLLENTLCPGTEHPPSLPGDYRYNQSSGKYKGSSWRRKSQVNKILKNNPFMQRLRLADGKFDCNTAQAHLVVLRALQ